MYCIFLHIKNNWQFRSNRYILILVLIKSSLRHAIFHYQKNVSYYKDVCVSGFPFFYCSSCHHHILFLSYILYVSLTWVLFLCHRCSHQWKPKKFIVISEYCLKQKDSLTSLPSRLLLMQQVYVLPRCDVEALPQPLMLSLGK